MQPKPEQHLSFVAFQRNGLIARFKGTELCGRELEPSIPVTPECSTMGGGNLCRTGRPSTPELLRVTERGGDFPF